MTTIMFFTHTQFAFALSLIFVFVSRLTSLNSRRLRSFRRDVVLSQGQAGPQETFLSNALFNVVFVNETRDGWIGDSDIKIHIEVLNNDYNATSLQFILVKRTGIKN
ncbi:hypothetical protein CPC08DRAFT_211907 [Agrocybe pediades]|nr:hypothetical protein CPC08DRAFT_211907 [Agrocybe pediades]